MIALLQGPLLKRVFICDCCSSRIRATADLRLTRRCDMPPDRSTVYHVHRHCLEPFVQAREGRWEQAAIPSEDDSWWTPISTGTRATRQHRADGPIRRSRAVFRLCVQRRTLSQ